MLKVEILQSNQISISKSFDMKVVTKERLDLRLPLLV